MPTVLFARTRKAGLLALTVTLALAAAVPVQAGSILSGPIFDSGDSHEDDCYSKREIKMHFQDYGLRHIKVSRTHDEDVFKVSGYANPDDIEPRLISGTSLKKVDYVRYVFLFDACSHDEEHLEPRRVPS